MEYLKKPQLISNPQAIVLGVISNKQFKGETYKVRLAIPIDSRDLGYPPQGARKIYGNLNLSAIDKKIIRLSFYVKQIS